jgi:Calcineurin-like phosphoesterase
VPALFCPNGGGLESGLCYRRCAPGWRGLGCTCWRGARSYTRGCGVAPRVCHAASYRAARLPPIAAEDDEQPFSLVLSADPQLFRVTTNWRDVPRSASNNAALASAITRVGELGTWPAAAGGGSLPPPRALVVLGDMTENYREDEVDAFRALYDPGFPEARNSSGSTSPDGDSGGWWGGSASPPRVSLPTWLLMGNHDYVNNAGDCGGQYKGGGRNACAAAAVHTMRSVLARGCDTDTWASFPRANVTSFDAGSLAYSFDVGRWHFVVLQYSPKYEDTSLAVSSSMGWLSAELSAATAQGRRSVLLLHSHRELGLAVDPTFSRLLSNSNVAAIFYGHVHVGPWGLTGNFPGTGVPMYNCGASWYHVYCVAEFGRERLRVGAIMHNASMASSGARDTTPTWAGTSVHELLRSARDKPVLVQFSANPEPLETSGARTASGSHTSVWASVVVAAALVAASQFRGMTLNGF